ncbi:UDP-N-acetyl-D-glucosamine 6-dehydrogenase [Moorella thermoacetica]|uniref:UDP-N-acetyl-D-glucosamine 6-dehydrogenase n=2 Tax=Neomoorella thermoacetica TaxID=1525 RepID=A0AAC9HGG1_NEOTH|nr:UDP-N-acetyl-D-glucosamine 6-dehydrogenase [Moorella thermoacetica]TYL13022.1 UDP-N-acetyl-D-glucosamine 6-dehydrogenase [Moorella thermoacetica]
MKNMRKIAVVGLGYVGLPLAVAFGQKQPVVGFDISEKRIATLKQGIDYNGEFSSEELQKASIFYTSDPQKLSDCDFIIVAVPTPVNRVHQPDLTMLIQATETVGRYLQPGSIVVYESTVYPGATEEECLPVLEHYSGLKAGKDFYVGYSPERINPGDREHTLQNIVKVVSAQNEEALEVIAQTYSQVVKAGIYKASSIRVAEAAKVIENTQRDLNIALMNELAIIFDKLGLDTREVLNAAGTKWNFLPFTPGLVGGHCIGVDPYYLTYKAESVGYHPEIILAGRRINDNMGRFIATSLIKQMILRDIPIQGSLVTILGITFKENVADIRNSKVVDIISELKDFGVKVQVADVMANYEEVEKEYGLRLVPESELQPADAVVLAVPHLAYCRQGWGLVVGLLKEQGGVVVDVKSVLDKKACPANVTLWRL